MNKKVKNFILILAIVSFVGMFIKINNLPSEVPVHFDFSGNVDGYGSKYTYLLIAALPLLILLLADVLPKIDPKSDNYKYHSKAYSITLGFIATLFVVIPWLIVLSIEKSINTSKIVFISVGILFILLGNYMPTFKQNFFCGIRTPWTLANEDVWRKTHRMGGYVFIADGLLMMLCALANLKMLSYITIAVIIAGVVFIYLYSYLCFKKIEKN